MFKSIIYYTDNKLKDPIKSVVKRYLNVGLPIISASLKPVDFGDNQVIDLKPGYPAIIAQIVSCLDRVKTKYVFFCEHDVLYPKSHFDFTPPREDIFYYNRNVWRWEYGSKTAIRYARMLPLSCLCCATNLAKDHFYMRLHKVIKHKDEFNTREPGIARKWGYEPGTKRIRRGGLTNDEFDTWASEEPVIDIRHKGTYSPTKTTLDSFKHIPTSWEEIMVDGILGWNVREIFNL